MKDHARLMSDTAHFMQCTYYTVIFCALAHNVPRSEQKACSDEAEVQLEQFIETNRLTEQVADFCLDVLTGKVPIFYSNGKQVPPPHGGNHGKRP